MARYYSKKTYADSDYSVTGYFDAADRLVGICTEAVGAFYPYGSCALGAPMQAKLSLGFIVDALKHWGAVEGAEAYSPVAISGQPAPAWTNYLGGYRYEGGGVFFTSPKNGPCGIVFETGDIGFFQVCPNTNRSSDISRLLATLPEIKKATDKYFEEMRHARN